MDNTLYLECNAGISGDMMVAALIDVGADETVLQNVLDSIPVDSFRVEISRVKKAGIDCCDFHVILDQENHDHDMNYLHGNAHTEHHHASHTQDMEQEHHHASHTQDEAHKHHHGANMSYILDILEKTNMTAGAREIARHIFEIIAKAEALAHGTSVDMVHFHEVGAVDSIVDIVATAVCLDNLKVRQVIVPKLCEGVGTVRCQHGILPIPVPAVANIIKEYKIPLEITGIKGEFVTPTGAAIVAAIQTSSYLPERFTIKKLGLGAGKRTYERPSILRAMMIEAVDTPKEESYENDIYKLESNIDDCSGEVLGYTMERLFEAGARDVHYHPVFMKKNRPGWQLNVICDGSRLEQLEQIIFHETTTIGIRRIRLERSVLERTIRDVQTMYGKVAVKVCTLLDGTKRYYPEYESVAAISREKHISYQEVYMKVCEACTGGAYEED